MKKPQLRTAVNYDRNKASDESGLQCLDKTRTKQSFAEECDINTIVNKFNLTGQLPTNLRPPTYGDFEDVPDFQSAMNAVTRARETFMQMPAGIRARFGNDPGAFVDFCSNPDNHGEMKKMGLLVPETPPKDAPEGTKATSTEPPQGEGTDTTPKDAPKRS